MPKRVDRTAICLKMASDLGRMCALDEAGMLEKQAGILEGLVAKTAPWWVPAGAGAVIGGPEHRLEGLLAGAGIGALGRRIGRHLAARQARQLIGKTKGLPEWLYDPATKDKIILETLRTHPTTSNIWKHLGPAVPQYEWAGTLLGGIPASMLVTHLAKAQQGARSPFVGAY